MVMLNMINLSLDMFKMERKMYQFQPVSVNVLQVIHKIMNETEPLEMAKKLSAITLINAPTRPGLCINRIVFVRRWDLSHPQENVQAL